MDNTILAEIKQIIINSIRSDLNIDDLNGNYQLIGNILDSMAVNTLILELEHKYGFTFNDDDLQAEFFETLSTLTELVARKISG